MRIVHVSDIHLFRPPHLRQLCGKRIAGTVNWLCRRHFQHDESLWDCFIKAMLKAPPAVLLFTGDLAQLGSVKELEAGARGLRLIREVGTTVLYVPGNHDRYVDDPAAEAAVARLENDFGGPAPGADGVRIIEVAGTEFILLSQVRPQGWFDAGGWMAPQQWRALERHSTTVNTLPRFVAGHFPLIDESGNPVKRSRSLHDAGQLRLLLQALNAKLYLCGHIHTPYQTSLHQGCTQLCAGSLTREGAYTELTRFGGELLISAEKVSLGAEKNEGPEGTAVVEEEL